MSETTRPNSNFLTEIVAADVAAGKYDGKVVTRFPPEPNGFLHIGHSKSILLNFGLAKQFGGQTHLRFDDTNPTTEDDAFVRAIAHDVKWLGCDFGDKPFFASDFFPQMYERAEQLVKQGDAYVDTQDQEAIREQRGSFEAPGTNSPFRNRSVEENLDLLRRMKAGEFKDGTCVLRAKIDMAHPNVLMRDPLLYRIRHAAHHRTGTTWCIYPMYDYAHPLEDAFEEITHSICTLEFESNRELYDWVIDHTGPWKVRPRQYEFARLVLGYTVMSKRKLLQLVKEKHVSGWDDPRMPTIAGMRRRGVTPESLRALSELVGVAKNNSLVDIGKFDFVIRQDLEARTPRALAVLQPLKVTLTNWDAGKTQTLDIPWWPTEPAKGGSRAVPFGKTLFIEREDFHEAPPKDWKRLAPGREVRLIGAYVVRCNEAVKNAQGDVVELRCTVDVESRTEAGLARKVAGAIHWVPEDGSFTAPVRLYDRLFNVEQPDAEGEFLQHLNADSLKEVVGAKLEPALKSLEPGKAVQFMRQGYFVVDTVDSKPGAPVFNRTIGLRDTWSKPVVMVEARAKDKKRDAAAEAGPAKKSRTELRAEARAANPELAKRYDRYRAIDGVSDEDADLLSADEALGAYFDAAVAPGSGAHPKPASVTKWLLNDLQGLASDGVGTLPLTGADFGRFVSLLDGGKLTPASAKTLLAALVKSGGDPSAKLAELGLDKVADSSVVDAALERVFSQQAVEVARYRAGEKKLIGVLVGAAMRELQGTADAATVRQALMAKLGS